MPPGLAIVSEQEGESMNRKLRNQLGIILLTVFLFAVLDFSIYQTFTKKVIPDTSPEMQAKSVEVSEYLPFREDSKIVKRRSEISLTGDLPVLDGAAALYPVFSAFVNAVYPEDSCIFQDGNFTPDSCLQMNNTRGAYQGVVDGTVDLVFCAGPSEQQLAYAREKGVELELVPVGREAFVFLVNKDNPVSDLTVEQVQGIYSGIYQNWSELGGEDERIAALQRNEGSGSQTALQKLMKGKKIVKDPDLFLGSAIGFSFRYYVEGIVSAGNVKMLSLNGVYPSKENIRNSRYPISNCFYAVYRKDNTNKNIPVLIRWILSEEGQQIIEESGYVGM